MSVCDRKFNVDRQNVPDPGETLSDLDPPMVRQGGLVCVNRRQSGDGSTGDESARGEGRGDTWRKAE